MVNHIDVTTLLLTAFFVAANKEYLKKSRLS